MSFFSKFVPTPLHSSKAFNFKLYVTWRFTMGWISANVWQTFCDQLWGLLWSTLQTCKKRYAISWHAQKRSTSNVQSASNCWMRWQIVKVSWKWKKLFWSKFPSLVSPHHRAQYYKREVTRYCFFTWVSESRARGSWECMCLTSSQIMACLPLFHLHWGARSIK